MNKLLVVYNLCGTRKEPVDYYRNTIQDILNQSMPSGKTLENEPGFEVVISMYKSTPRCKRILLTEFGDSVSYIYYDQADEGALSVGFHSKDNAPIRDDASSAALTVNQTFNKTVQICVEEWGEFEGYMYVDSGISFHAENYKEFDTIIFKAWELFKSDDSVGEVHIQVDSDAGYQQIGLEADSPCGDVQITGENLTIPIGKGVNCHINIHSNLWFKEYGNRILPDVFAAFCSESIYTFLGAAVGQKCVILKDAQVHHKGALEGWTSSSSDFEHLSPVHNNPWNNLLCNRDALDFINDPEAIDAGLGYEEVGEIMVHKKEAYDENGNAKHPERLKEITKKYFFLSEKEFDYDNIRYKKILKQGEPKVKIKYPLAKETINEEDINALCDWLKSYPRLTKGQLTWDVEDAWSKYIGTRYAVFNNSGSSANLLMVYAAILAGRIKNKKIVVPSVGWVTTIAPAIQFGLEPIMVGADPKTFGIDLKQLETICEKERPDAVIYVQVLGVPHYREELLALKEKYGFILLEDSCAALGASYSDGQMVGTIGDMSSFSFYFGHQLSTIEGGMVNTSDKELYKALLMLRSHGWGKDLPKGSYDKLIEEHGIDDFHKPFTFFVAGFNLRSTDLQAFLGLRQIDKAKWVAEQRNKNHLLYAELLNGYVEFQDWCGHNPVSISFGALAKSKEHRTEIVNRLVENGIETRIFSAGNLGRHPFWVKRYGEFVDEMSDRIHSCGFFVPNYPEMTEDDVKFVCSVVKGEK